MKRSAFSLVLLLLAVPGWGQTATSPKLCAECIQKNMETLASDAMRGRESGTEDEHKAARHIASLLKSYGIQPAGDQGGFVQRIATVHSTIIGNPKVTVLPESEMHSFTLGKDFLSVYVSRTQFSGTLKKIDLDKAPLEPEPGHILLLTGSDLSKVRAAAFSAFANGEIAVLIPARNKSRSYFENGASKLPKINPRLVGHQTAEIGTSFNILEFTPEAIEILLKIPDGTRIQFHAPVSLKRGFTWNAVGMLRGTDPVLQHAAVLFSAHLDHIGVGRPVNGDSIYNGADDDASGTAAVLELARVLGSAEKPKRTVIFALFGSEEVGGLGSTYFREHPAVPLKEIAANLEFEMIGRPDPKVAADALWLTGWERTNLGPMLAEHGAQLVQDPHPEEDFFSRSDNYVLAKKGVVAQTISSYGLHSDYHRPSDDIEHIDFKHMNAAIESLLEPIEWLVNSDFKPQWKEGGQP